MKRVDLEVAVAAGLSVAFPLYNIYTLRKLDGRPNPLSWGEAAQLLLVLACYVAAAFLLPRLLDRGRVFRPAWLWVAVVGSAFGASAYYGQGLYHLRADAERAATVWLVMTVWTLPVAAAVHYAGAAARRLRRWHEGSDKHLSSTPR